MSASREEDQAQAKSQKRRLIAAEDAIERLKRENQILRDILRKKGIQLSPADEGADQNSLGYRDLMHPRLAMLFSFDESEAKDRGHVLDWETSSFFSWVFLGIGHDGDLTGFVMRKLGRQKFRIVYESLVPVSRIFSPLTQVLRLEDDGGARELTEILADRAHEMRPLIKRPDGRLASDFFIVAAMSEFGINEDVAQRLSRLLAGLRLEGEGAYATRFHGLFYRDADSPTKHQHNSFLGLLENGELQSCFVVDPNHLASFGGSRDDFKRVAATVVGHLDCFERAARSQPLRGAFGDQDLARLLNAGGFSVQGVAATFEASRILETIEGSLSRGLFWPGVSTAACREAAILVFLGESWLEREPEILPIVEQAMDSIREAHPHVRWRFAIHCDGRASIRVLSFLAGVNDLATS